MGPQSKLLLSFLMIISMGFVTHCSFLDDIVDPNIISDITGIGEVAVGGVVERGFPAWQRSEPSLPAGLNVALTCDGVRTTIAVAVTDTEGVFQITFSTSQNPLFPPTQCDACRIVVRGNYVACLLSPGSRGALLAPINCRDAVVEKLHGGERGRDCVVQFKAEPF